MRAVALDAGDEIGALGIEREGFDRDAFLLERLLQVVDGAGLVSGRAAGVELHQRAVVAEDLRLLLLPVDRRRGRGERRQRAADQGGRQRGGESERGRMRSRHAALRRMRLCGIIDEKFRFRSRFSIAAFLYNLDSSPLSLSRGTAMAGPGRIDHTGRGGLR